MRSDDRHEQHLTRRDVIAAGMAAAAGALAAGRRAFAAPPPPSPYGPFKMGIQSYSLRGYTTDGKPDLAKALKVTQSLGLKYWESYVAHVPVVTEPAQVAALTAQLAEYGVSVIGYGVMRFTKDHDANKKVFEFAKAMNLGYLSADPDPDSFDSLDRLVEEYGVAIGIHNHGPRARYEKIDQIAAAIKDHHAKIGCCIDTGHFLRSKEDPVRAVEVFGPRTYGVHLKDVKDATHFTVLGKGDLRTVDLLKALAKIKYDYCLALEYEEHPENPVDEIRECLTATKQAVAAL
jgi:sugar phosphate isomerase/epimerase